MHPQLQTIKRELEKQAPTLMSIGSIGGFAGAMIMAVKATPKANEVLREQEPFISEKPLERILDVSKLLLPIYGPAIGTFMLSSGLVILSNRLSVYRYNAATAMVFASQKALDRLQDAIVDEVGPKKFDEIRAKATFPPEDREIPPETLAVREKKLCYDVYSDRFFYADSIEDLLRVAAELNDEMRLDGWTALNEFYWAVGLPKIPYGYNMGWAIENGPIDLTFDSMLIKGADGRTCITISFRLEPKHVFARFGEG